ncbi:Na+/H+ antiporter, partial [Burkholderia pseudomallei]
RCSSRRPRRRPRISASRAPNRAGRSRRIGRRALRINDETLAKLMREVDFSETALSTRKKGIV